MENNFYFIRNNIIDGRVIAAALFSDITSQVAKLPFKPILCDVVVGEDPVSLSYVKIKGKKAIACGMDFSLIQLPESATTEEVINAILDEQAKPNLCGLIVQLPLPPTVQAENILEAINLTVDVDNINPTQKSLLVPPTAGAILHILTTLPVDLSKEQFLVLGQGELVGKPITKLLHAQGFTVAVADANTEHKAELLKQATVIIAGVGKAGILTGKEISEGVIVIDAGTSESGGSIAGDVNFATVAPKARFITPSPGGVGPVTVAKLLENVLTVAQNK